MSFGGGLGVSVTIENMTDVMFVSETPSRYLIEVATEDADAFAESMKDVSFELIGEINDSNTLTVGNIAWDCETLKSCWLEGMVI